MSGDSEKNNDSEEISNENWQSVEFEDEKGKGTVNYDDKGSYNVEYDNGKGHGHSTELEESYTYSSTYNSSSSTFMDTDGNISSMSKSTNESAGDYIQGTQTVYEDTWYGGKVRTTGYTTEQFNGNSYDVTVANNTYDIAGLEINSPFNDVTVNGIDVGLLGSLGYSIGGVFGAMIGAVIGMGLSIYLGAKSLIGGLKMISSGGLGSVIGLNTAAQSLKSLRNNFKDLNTMFNLGTMNLNKELYNPNKVNQDYISNSNGKVLLSNYNLNMNSTLLQEELENRHYDEMLSISDLDTAYEFRAGGEYYNMNAGTIGHKVSAIAEPSYRELGFDINEDKLLDDIVFAKENIKY